MFIKQQVPECDFDGIKYDTPTDGAGALARGASGRWCVVMYAGPEYLERNDIKPITPEEAEEYIAKHHPRDRCDF
jgi:hypothetical protein